MRLYTFSNMYLSSLQVGLQSAHVLAEMLLRYESPSFEPFCKYKRTELHQWMRDHKTIIMLNGGYSSALENLITMFSDVENVKYPWAKFHEGEDALGGALTCVGIVLPESIYKTAAFLRTLKPKDKTQHIVSAVEHGYINVPDCPESRDWSFNRWDVLLMEELNKYRLAS